MTLRKIENHSLILDRIRNGPCKEHFLAKLSFVKHATVVSDRTVQQLEDELVEIFC